MKIIIFVVCCYFTLNTCLSQNCKAIKDTLYFINIYCIKNNNNPKTGGGLIKYLSKINFDITSYDSFRKSFYSTVVYTPDPFIGFQSSYFCYGIADYKELTKCYIKKQKQMLRKEMKLPTITLKDSTKFDISVYKIIGEFWLIENELDKINSMTDQINIDTSFYNFTYYYKFKNIIKSWKLTKLERESLFTTFHIN